MNIWYLVIACAVIGVVSFHFFLRTDEEEHELLVKWLGRVAGIAVLAILFLVFYWFDVEDQKDSRKKESALEGLGFRYVNISYDGETARVSLRGYPVGCRVDLNREDGKWFAEIAGVEYKTPITGASEFTQRKEFIRWCGP